MDGRDAHLGACRSSRENDVAACGIRGGSGSGSTSGLGGQRRCRRSLGARWHGWARTNSAEGDSHGVGELVDALLDLDADFMSKVRSLASARTLMAKRRGAATRRRARTPWSPGWPAMEAGGRGEISRRTFFPRTAGRSSRARARRTTTSPRETRETWKTSSRSHRRSPASRSETRPRVVL